MLESHQQLIASATFVAPLLGLASVVFQRLGNNRAVGRLSNSTFFGVLFVIAAATVPLLFCDYSGAMVLGVTLVGMTVSATIDSGHDRRPRGV